VRVADLSPGSLRSSLRADGLLLPFGPLQARVIANEAGFARCLHRLYGSWDAMPADRDVGDITLCLRRRGLRHWVWVVNGRESQRTFRRPMALAQFEWAMHLAMAVALAPRVSIHAAVVVRPDGRAAALVGRSGTGKSTLAAGLVAAGWTLAADEFLVLEPSGGIVPIPAVITLKGNSIDLIRSRSPVGTFSPVAVDPERGPIAHYAAPRLARPDADIDLRTIIFPRYAADAEPTVRTLPRGEAIIRLGRQSHNLHLAGPEGFRLVAGLARRPVHAIRYAGLDAGMQAVNDLLEQA
jgi:HprK-related kinase A